MFGRKLHDCDGGLVEVIDPGKLNTDSGPDFFNSKIRVDGIEWAGNVEIHIKASDWMRHHHDRDIAYDNIILHVVGVSDIRIRRSDGSLIPQVEIVMPEDFFRTYSLLETQMEGVKCSGILGKIPELEKTDWLETLSVERMQVKAGRVLNFLETTGGDWEQTCFILLSRAMGFGLNGEPFEILARSIPLKILHHHSDNPLQLQALLFGQASMLDSSQHIFDEYYQLMCREYYFLARKYGIRPMNAGLWKYSRTRPQNFPHRRIAYLSKACENGFSMFSRIIDNRGDSDSLRSLFAWQLEGYWHDHFSFDTPARMVSDTLSDASVTSLLINVVAPLLYAYGVMSGNLDITERAVSLMESLPGENNSVIRKWVSCGLKAENAWRSQSLLHLMKEYCNARKCLYCRFGNRLLRYSSVEVGVGGVTDTF